MPLPERPALRPYLALQRSGRSDRPILVHDQLRLSDAVLQLADWQFAWVKLFDGSRTLREIQAEAIRLVGGQLVALEVFQNLAEQLDEALFLDTPRFRDRAEAPVRPPACVGCYEADPDRLRRQLAELFTGPDGPGLPGEPASDGSLRAVLAPHIDYARGGTAYGHAFKELFHKNDADLFVIVGTSHYSPARFTLTRKHFQTPLGTVETDGAFVDRLVSAYGDGLFDDELRAHLPEHSIELEVVPLQFLYEGRRPFRIVPLAVGSFQDAIAEGNSPGRQEDVARMAAALREAEAATPGRVCYVISGDLAHIGPKFGDRVPVAEPLLSHSRAQDDRLIRCAEAAGPEAYFRVVADEGDARRICGLPPTWTVLTAARPARGRLLAYGRYVHPRGQESVSFASMAFYR
jgi:AmmeMemoRadiSam system protein B